MPVTAVRVHRSSALRVCALVATLAGAAAPLSASDTVRLLSIHASIAPATSLQVSSHVLVFDVTDEGGTAVSTVSYVASARTARDSEVFLSIEATRPAAIFSGAAAAGATLTVTDNGGPVSQVLANQAIATQWVGGGTRAGQLVFTLRSAPVGRYLIPVRFLLLAP